MSRSTIRFLAGFIAVASLGFGVFAAQADGANGPDAGIGIPGYNLDYEHSADGSGPGYPRHPVPERYRQDSYRNYGPHYYNGY